LISSLGGKEEEQRLTLVMERRAMTLPEALRRGLSRDERKLIAYDVAEAFSFLQGQGIPHGNFTAESISLDSQNRAKLDAMKLRPSGKDSWLGCSAYHQAPEVILDKNARNPATDVYSFGVLLWEIFNESLQPPACYSDCTTKEDIKKRVCEEGLRPSKPDHLADEWYGIMEECWKEPEDRPSMEDLATKIKDLVFSNQEEEGYSSS
jgi:serine/threonine protein kinase